MAQFTFYEEFYTYTLLLKSKYRLQLYDALVKYAIYGEEPTLCEPLMAIFNLMRQKIEQPTAEPQPTIEEDIKEIEQFIVETKPYVVGGIKEQFYDQPQEVVEPKPVDIYTKAEKFGEQVKEFETLYPPEMIKQFIDYWTEPNKRKTKLRYELERTWDTKRRLATWARNQKTFNNGTNQQPYQSTAERNRQELQQSAWRVLAKYSDN